MKIFHSSLVLFDLSELEQIQLFVRQAYDIGITKDIFQVEGL